MIGCGVAQIKVRRPLYGRPGFKSQHGTPKEIDLSTERDSANVMNVMTDDVLMYV
jgi:hypothetical protein